MKTNPKKNSPGAGPLNAGKKKQARTVGGAAFRSLTAIEADK
jgi:hypothetical protein